MNIKETFKNLASVLTKPRTIAALQFVVVAVTLVHAIKRLKQASQDDK